ncbi:unnamed protein product [Euphydryas editha]|uniref:Uncharacterized protein n=1 Tax=Euphydryas editha TaxID=104508 RepID=A0AAU9U826_EUPED|nr:unnamed protein product [Euphydryas editha]
MLIDEQIIPFSERSEYRQYVPAERNPFGLKNLEIKNPLEHFYPIWFMFRAGLRRKWRVCKTYIKDVHGCP